MSLAARISYWARIRHQIRNGRTTGMGRIARTTVIALIGAAMVGCGAPVSTDSGSANATTALGSGPTAENGVNGGTSSDASSNPLIGQPVPDFTLEKLDGTGKVQLHDLLGKTPILLNAWASWCGPCQKETPDLVEAAKQYSGKVQFVGINMTTQDSIADAKSFVSQYHIGFMTLTDPQGSFLANYRIIGFPTTFLVSPDGKVLDVHIGGMTKSMLTEMLQKALRA